MTTTRPTKRREPTISDADLDSYLQQLFIAPAEVPSADALFEPKADTLAPDLRRARWRGCVVCGRKDGAPYRDGHDVCRACGAAPELPRAHLATQRAGHERQAQEAIAAAEAAHAALTPEERARYERFAALRDQPRRTPEEDALLARTRDAYDRADPRISEALRRYRTADEWRFWCLAALPEVLRRLDARAAQLEEAIAP